MPPTIARLAGLGAFGVCVALAALFALIAWIAGPSPSAGLDATQRFLTLFTIAGVVLALIGVHVLLGRQLLAVARGESRPA